MKVEDNRCCSTRFFYQLNRGQVFYYHDLLYMKTDSHDGVNSVGLTGNDCGRLLYFKDHDGVEVVDPILTIN